MKVLEQELFEKILQINEKQGGVIYKTGINLCPILTPKGTVKKALKELGFENMEDFLKSCSA